MIRSVKRNKARGTILDRKLQALMKFILHVVNRGIERYIAQTVTALMAMGENLDSTD